LAPIILGFILGPMIEINFRRAIMFSKGNLTEFITKPISGIFIFLTILSLGYTVYKNIKNSKQAAKDVG
jgi:putative tricarboxylic transport membrane protein